MSSYSNSGSSYGSSWNYHSNQNVMQSMIELAQWLKFNKAKSFGYEARLKEYNDLTANYPDIERALLQEDISSSSSDSGNRRWDEVAFNKRYQGPDAWNSFLKICPQHTTFVDQIDHLVAWLKAEQDHLERNKSQYGETYLIGWALYHMPAPLKCFLDWSLRQEEFEEGRCAWTILGFEEHLKVWTAIFDSEWAYNWSKDYLSVPNNTKKCQHLYPVQELTGGGWMAHFLYSTMEGRRKAFQLFKTIWRGKFRETVLKAGIMDNFKTDVEMSWY